MTALAEKRMTAEEFLVWAVEQPGHWELIDGAPVEMLPKRVIHGRTKYLVTVSLEEGIAQAGLPCEFLLGGPGVRIDLSNLYVPDAMVYCGERLPGDSILVPNPIIVVEVLSPGTALKDMRDKLQGYFRLPSIHHYLIVDPDERFVIHHARRKEGAVTTRIVSEGNLTVHPPGLTLLVPMLFRTEGLALA